MVKLCTKFEQNRTTAAELLRFEFDLMTLNMERVLRYALG